MTDPLSLSSSNELADLVAERAAGAAHRLVVAVAGPPASGKSTVADGVVETLNRCSSGTAAVLPMDGFHYDDLVLDERGWRSRKGAPHTFDVAGFSHMLARLRRNDEDEVAVPVFDRSIEIARAGARIIPRSIDVLVVEGNYLLLAADPWDRLARHFDLTVFYQVDEHEIRRRLEDRWSDLPPEARSAQIDGNDLPNARLIIEQSRQPDIVLRP